MNIKEKTDDGIVFEKQSYKNIEQLWPESRTILIPASSKHKILNDLEKLGIHKRRLFPELEMQANYVTEYIDSIE